MNDEFIITVYVVIDEVLKALGHESHVLAQVSDAEVLTVAVVAAKYFQNQHERSLWVMQQSGYIAKPLSTSRFNRRLHQLAHWLEFAVYTLGELFSEGEVFIQDSMPVPVCKRVRAWRCRKVRGRAYCGYCAAKKEKFFGWRLHLICTPSGMPVTFTLLPGGLHDLTPVHELTFSLPSGATVFADKGYNAEADEASLLSDMGVRLIPKRKANMKPHDWADDYDLRLYRHRIETVNSQLESMGLERLHARTNLGLELKLHASLLALACSIL